MEKGEKYHKRVLSAELCHGWWSRLWHRPGSTRFSYWGFGTPYFSPKPCVIRHPLHQNAKTDISLALFSSFSRPICLVDAVLAPAISDCRPFSLGVCHATNRSACWPHCIRFGHGLMWLWVIENRFHNRISDAWGHLLCETYSGYLRCI